jgi:hypothetical protein
MAKCIEHDRVTEVLYPFSGLSRVDPDILKQAADRGSKVHEICEAITNDLGVIDMNPDFSGYIRSFEQWAEGKEFIERPARFYCNQHYITGEIDGLYENETGLTLFDIKTPATEKKTWPLQGSAYSYLAKKAGLNITKIEFVKLSKGGEKATSYFYDENIDLFLKCLELYRKFFKTRQTLSYLDFL